MATTWHSLVMEHAVGSYPLVTFQLFFIYGGQSDLGHAPPRPPASLTSSHSGLDHTDLCFLPIPRYEPLGPLHGCCSHSLWLGLLEQALSSSPCHCCLSPCCSFSFALAVCATLPHSSLSQEWDHPCLLYSLQRVAQNMSQFSRNTSQNA